MATDFILGHDSIVCPSLFRFYATQSYSIVTRCRCHWHPMPLVGCAECVSGAGGDKVQDRLPLGEAFGKLYMHQASTPFQPSPTLAFITVGKGKRNTDRA